MASLGGKSTTLISLESSAQQLATWQTNTQTANDRVQAMYSAMGDMIDQLTSLRSTLSAAKSGAADAATLNDTGAGLLEDLADLMNLRQDGRYLFAGSNTGTAPVDTSLLSTPSIPSSADAAYYTGNDELASVRISGQQTLTYGVTAGGSAFEKALRASNIVATMTTTPLDEDALDEAYDLATEALDGLIAAQSGLSNNASRLETASTRQTAALDLLDTMAGNIKAVDVAAVTIKLSQYETQLTASYSALGNLSSLSLAKYL
ncbi:MAG: flagellin [Magnetospirillum sp.]|nr:flagellin [Magnetospirillum sp.]